MDIGGIGERNWIPTSRVDQLQQGSLRLDDDQVVVQPSNEHVVSRPGGGVGELGQQPRPAMASLRDRTVPRWQARGALAGALVTALAAGAAGGILIGLGKGALIGAAMGSIVPGAGTVVGAIVGGVLGGIVSATAGALIGRLAGGVRAENLRADKLRADHLIVGLLNEKKITPEEAGSLRGMSDSDLSALVSISKRWTGIAEKADRDAVRRAALMAAATDPREAKLLKAELLKLPPERAALGARNVITLGVYLRAHRVSLFKAARQNPVRLQAHWRYMRDAVVREARAGREVGPAGLRALTKKAFEYVDALRKTELPNLEAPNREAIAARNVDALKFYLDAKRNLLSVALGKRARGDGSVRFRLDEYRRYMRDAVVREARRGKEVDQVRLNALSTEAIEHVNTFPDDEALSAYQQKRLDFEATARSFIEFAAGAPTGEEMAKEVKKLRQSFEAMQAKKGPAGSFDLLLRFEEAFARVASPSSTRPIISQAALRALRAVNDGGDDGARSTVAATVNGLALAHGVPTRAFNGVFKKKEEEKGPSKATGRPVIDGLESGFRAMEEVRPKNTGKSERVNSESDEDWIV